MPYAGALGAVPPNWYPLRHDLVMLQLKERG